MHRPTRRVYRTDNVLIGLAICAASTTAFLVIAILPGRGQIVGWIFVPVLALTTWRQWNLGAHIDSVGVKIVGYLVSRRVPWGDIDHFEVRPWNGYPCVGHLVGRNGRAIQIVGISASKRHRPVAEAPIYELDQVLAEWRSAHADPEPARD
jgi:hypothetical protein